MSRKNSRNSLQIVDLSRLIPIWCLIPIIVELRVGILVLDLVKNLKNCDNCIYNMWIRVRCQICSDSLRPRLDKPRSQTSLNHRINKHSNHPCEFANMNIIRRHNLDIFILCQDSLRRVSDIRVLSHGTVCQLRPSRPIGQLTTFILLKRLEVSIRENNCGT